MDKTQSFLKKKKRSFIIITSITLVLVLIVAVLGVKIAYNIPWNYDMTATRLFTLSEQSQTVIDSLTEPVQIGAVYSAGTEEMMVESLLDEYDQASEMISVEYIDAVKEPSKLARYNLDLAAVPNGSIIVKMRDHYKLISSDSLFATSSEGQNTFSGEQQITGALRFVSSSDMPVVYVTTGHSETNPDEKLTVAMTNMGLAMYDMKPLNLQQTSKVPDDADIVIMMNPVEDISERELELYKEYLKTGGGLLLCTDAVTNTNSVQLPNLNALCNSFGLDITNNYVVEEDQNNHLSVSPMYLVPDMGAHEITQQIGIQELQVALPIARGIGTVEYDKNTVKHEMLLASSEKSWARVDMANGSAIKTEGDKDGPIPLAYAVTISNVAWGNEAARVVVIGDTTFATDGNIEFQGNNDLWMNSLNWIEGARQNEVISAKVIGGNSLIIRGTDFVRLATICVGVIPLICFAAALAVWMLRRNQ